MSRREGQWTLAPEENDAPSVLFTLTLAGGNQSFPYYYAAREVDCLFLFERQSLQRLKVNSELVPDNAYDDELMMFTLSTASDQSCH
jgi:hypothetical protein